MCVCVSDWVVSSLQLHLLTLIQFWLLPVPAFPWRSSLSASWGKRGKKYETWPLTFIFFFFICLTGVAERERKRERGSPLELCGGKMCKKWCQSLFGGEDEAGSQAGDVRSAFCDLACRTWQERRLRWGCKGEVLAGASISKLFEGNRFIAPRKGWEASGWVNAWLEKIGSKL